MIDPTPSGRNPITGAMPTTGPSPVVEPQTRLQKLAYRMRHVYHTRMRTTTLVLCGVWLGLLAFYGFSSGHYDPPVETTNRVTQTPEPQAPATTQAPLSTTTESTPTTTGETATSTESTPTDEPATPRQSAPAQTHLSTVPSADNGGELTTPETSTGR